MAAILWFRQKFCPGPLVTLGPRTPHPPISPLKVSRGHMGNIQFTHMGGWLDVPGPHITLGPGTPPLPPLKVSRGHMGNIQCTHMGGMHCSIWSDAETRDKWGWTSHRSCLSTASSLNCRGARVTHPCVEF